MLRAVSLIVAALMFAASGGVLVYAYSPQTFSGPWLPLSPMSGLGYVYIRTVATNCLEGKTSTPRVSVRFDEPQFLSSTTGARAFADDFGFCRELILQSSEKIEVDVDINDALRPRRVGDLWEYRYTATKEEIGASAIGISGMNAHRRTFDAYATHLVWVHQLNDRDEPARFVAKEDDFEQQVQVKSHESSALVEARFRSIDSMSNIFLTTVGVVLTLAFSLMAAAIRGR